MYINVILFKDFLKEKTGAAYFTSGQKEIICKCPKCESTSLKKHGHLYVSNVSSKGPVFNCVRCGEYHGFVGKLIKDLGGNVKDFINFENIEFFNKFDKNNFKSEKTIQEYTDDSEKISNSKIKYLQERLGNVDIKTIPNLVLNISDFFKSTKLPEPTNPYSLDFLDENYIGFITLRKYFMVMRNIFNNTKYRYTTHEFEDPGIFKDFYGFQTKPVDDIHNTIILSEGVFDILNTFYNHSGNYIDIIKREGVLWAATLGKNYKNIIPSVLDYCRLPSAHFIILSDSDVLNDDYQYLKWNPCISTLEIYWNKIGKDFGEKNIEIVRNRIK